MKRWSYSKTANVLLDKTPPLNHQHISVSDTKRWKSLSVIWCVSWSRKYIVGAFRPPFLAVALSWQ